MMKRLGQILQTPWFFRRLVLLWACTLCSFIVIQTFDKLDAIDGGDATLIGTFFTVLSIGVEFYRRDRLADAQAKDDDLHPEPADEIPAISEEPTVEDTVA